MRKIFSAKRTTFRRGKAQKYFKYTKSFSSINYFALFHPLFLGLIPFMIIIIAILFSPSSFFVIVQNIKPIKFHITSPQTSPQKISKPLVYTGTQLVKDLSSIRVSCVCKLIQKKDLTRWVTVRTQTFYDASLGTLSGFVQTTHTLVRIKLLVWRVRDSQVPHISFSLHLPQVTIPRVRYYFPKLPPIIISLPKFGTSFPHINLMKYVSVVEILIQTTNQNQQASVFITQGLYDGILSSFLTSWKVVSSLNPQPVFNKMYSITKFIVYKTADFELYLVRILNPVPLIKITIQALEFLAHLFVKGTVAGIHGMQHTAHAIDNTVNALTGYIYHKMMNFLHFIDPRKPLTNMKKGLDYQGKKLNAFGRKIQPYGTLVANATGDTVKEVSIGFATMFALLSLAVSPGH